MRRRPPRRRCGSSGPSTHRPGCRRSARRRRRRRGPGLREDRRPGPARCLDARDQPVGRRRVRAVGEHVAEVQLLPGRVEQADRRRPHGRRAIEVVRVGRRTGEQAGHQGARPGRHRPELLGAARRRGRRVAAGERTARRGVGPVGVRRPAAARPRSRRRTSRTASGRTTSRGRHTGTTRAPRGTGRRPCSGRSRDAIRLSSM